MSEHCILWTTAGILLLEYSILNRYRHAEYMQSNIHYVVVDTHVQCSACVNVPVESCSTCTYTHLHMQYMMMCMLVRVRIIFHGSISITISMSVKPSLLVI